MYTPSADVNALSLAPSAAAYGELLLYCQHACDDTLRSVCSLVSISRVTIHSHALMNPHIRFGNMYLGSIIITNTLHDIIIIMSWSLCADITLTVRHTMTVFKVIMETRVKWYFIGEGLGLDTADLHEIQAQHHSDNARCLLEVLQLRIRQGRLTQSMLCASLRQSFVNRDDIAQKIESLTLD